MGLLVFLLIMVLMGWLGMGMIKMLFQFAAYIFQLVGMIIGGLYLLIVMVVKKLKK